MTKTEAMEKIMEYFRDNLEVFAECIEELDGYNGYLGDDRLYPMSELGDLLDGYNAYQIIDMVRGRSSYDFDLNDEYFYFDCYGLRSTDDREEHYEDFLDKYAIEKMADTRHWVDTIDRNDELCELFDQYENADDEEGE